MSYDGIVAVKWKLFFISEF